MSTRLAFFLAGVACLAAFLLLPHPSKACTHLAGSDCFLRIRAGSQQVRRRVMKFSNLRSRALIDVELALLAWFSLAAGSGLGQSPPLLQVTSPPDGTVVHPGDTVTIVVAPSTGVSFAMVALFGEGGLTKDQVLG